MGIPEPQNWEPPVRRLPPPFDYYKLIRKIGCGSQGVVWEAESDRHLGTPLAIKFFCWERMAGVEAERTIAINHPSIVRTFEFLNLREHVGAGWLPSAMSMMLREPSLQTVLDDLRKSGHRLPQEVASRFARNLVEALDVLHHRQDLVHRDVKPTNILISMPQGHIYTSVASLARAEIMLSDLGVAWGTGKLAEVPLGQDGWKGPELFDPVGSRLLDQPVQPNQDIFALGKVLLALADVTEGNSEFVRKAARDCMVREPDKRPEARTGRGLWLLVSPDYPIQNLMVSGGWKPDLHSDFVGRDFVFQKFDQFRNVCGEQGGVFLVEGEPGVGKTALLTAWTGRGAPHPAYFFSSLDGRTNEVTMLETLFKAVCSRYAIDKQLPAQPEGYADAMRALLAGVSHEKLGPQERLLLLVDAVDEASSPKRAVELLPKPPLPRGVYLVVASRPPTGKKNHLRPLLAAPAGIEHFLLRAEDENNRADVEFYVKTRLHDRVKNGQAQTLVRNLGGIFQLAVYLVEAVREGRTTVSEALQATQSLADLPVQEKLSHWYYLQWERITDSLEDKETERLTRFLSC
jgi:serine/threonine protein kinase